MTKTVAATSSKNAARRGNQGVPPDSAVTSARVMPVGSNGILNNVQPHLEAVPGIAPVIFGQYESFACL